MSDTLTIARHDFEAADNAKRRQIIEGARAVFLAQGFDAASMNDIARKAGVSKGTLYVYFDSKEALFVAIADEQCHKQAESVFVLDEADRDVAGVLTRLGNAFTTFMCNRSRSRTACRRSAASSTKPAPRSASQSCHAICRRRSRPVCSTSTSRIAISWPD